jgi:hypothetical protein
MSKAYSSTDLYSIWYGLGDVNVYQSRDRGVSTVLMGNPMFMRVDYRTR